MFLFDTAGCGPFGLGPAPRPLPFATSRVSPAASTAVGYQPTGMRPTRRSRPRSRPEAATPEVADERSKTATALLSDSATSRRRPAAASARALGVLPSGGPAGGASRSCAITRRVRVSTTATRSVLAEATNRRAPPAASSNADGWRPTSMRPAATRPAAGRAEGAAPADGATGGVGAVGGAAPAGGATGGVGVVGGAAPADGATGGVGAAPADGAGANTATVSPPQADTYTSPPGATATA